MPRPDHDITTATQLGTLEVFQFPSSEEYQYAVYQRTKDTGTITQQRVLIGEGDTIHQAFTAALFDMAFDADKPVHRGVDYIRPDMEVTDE